jgi:hypothetical protein
VKLAFSCRCHSAIPLRLRDGPLCRTRISSRPICPFGYGLVSPGTGGIVHAQGSASLGGSVAIGLVGRTVRAGTKRRVSMRAARVSTPFSRQFADILSWNGVCSAYSNAACAAADSTETADPRPSSGGTEAGSTTAVDPTLAGTTRRGRSGRRECRRLDGTAGAHEEFRRPQFSPRFAAGRTDALHLLDAE